MKTLEELKVQVLKFDRLELPGQPMGMHMGTAYLVHDLFRLAKHYAEQLAEAKKKAAFYKSCALSGEIPKPGSEPSAAKADEGEK